MLKLIDKLLAVMALGTDLIVGTYAVAGRLCAQALNKMGSVCFRIARLPVLIVLSSQYWKAAFILIVTLFASGAYATTPAGTAIDNTASASFDIGSGPLATNSNTLTVVTERSPATIELFQHTPGFATLSEETPSSCRNGDGGPFVGSADPVVAIAGSGATTLDANNTIELSPTQIYHTGDPIFVQVSDADQNLDQAAAETIVVTVSSSVGDQEDIRMLETGPNTGVFIGYVQSSANTITQYDCQLAVSAESSVTASYTDQFDSDDATSASTLVDPFGIAFDSNNGDPVDGITVTLIDAATGQPATPGVHIFGDDGVSAYPNTLVTGSSATDSGGTVVVFPEGGYRFPLLLPGDYRLRVNISPGYSAPSLSQIVDLQNLPNAPFALYSNASYGNTFTLNPGPPLHVDIPVDPVTVQLVVTKTASKDRAGVGDFVQYRVGVENADAVASAREVLINDVLPQGFRYQTGSARMDGAILADPTIAQDGRSLTFLTRDMPAGTLLEISYVAEVTAGAPLGEAVNSASATDRLNASSNIALARVEVFDEFMREHVTLMGRVIVGNCPMREAGHGEASLRLRGDYQEDIVNYTLDLSVGKIEVLNYTTTVSIPDSVQYLPGSSRLSGIAISDPEVVGNKLVFRLGNGEAWPKDWQHGLSFQTQIKAGSEQQSLTAQAYSVMDTPYKTGQKIKTAVLKLDLSSLDTDGDSGTTKVNIIGHTEGREPAKVGTDLKGLAGVRLYLENGSYVVTDAEGKYHFEGILPGTHVVQLDEASLPSDVELIRCEENTRFAGKANSQFVDVRGGTLWRADFHVQSKPPVVSEATLEMLSEVKGKDIALTLNMKNGVVSLSNYRLNILLPDGMSYELGSSELDGRAVADPEIRDAMLVYRLKDFSASSKKTLTLKTKLLDMVEGELSVKAYVLFNTEDNKNKAIPAVENIVHKQEDQFAEKLFVFQPKFGSFETKLSSADKKELDQFIRDLEIVSIENLLVLGHTDNVPIKRKNRHIYKDNYELSEARAKVVADYIRDALGLDEESVVYEGKGPDKAIEDNSTAEGRAKNRRTELYINAVQLTSEGGLSVSRNRSGVERVSISGREDTGDVKVVNAPPLVDKPSVQRYDVNWLNTQQPGIEWLFPKEGFIPAIAAVSVAIKHRPEDVIKSFVNGEELNPLFYFGREVNGDNSVARSYWQGIHLKDGPNKLEFIIKDKQGDEVERFEKLVHFSGHPVRAELVKEYSHLVADGVNPPVIAIKFYDQWNKPVRPGVIGQFSISEPYFSKEFLDATKENPLDGLNRKNPQYTIGDHGIALIELEPTIHSGQAKLNLHFSGEIQQEIKAWLKPSQRDWIVVGVADTMLGENKLSENEQSAINAGFEDESYQEGRVAVFAKGTINDDWLFTGSIDSSKDEETVGNSLFQTIDPDKHFTLYGDKTEQYYEAPSSEKVFAKVERDTFYAMFGDYNTNLNDNELSKYNRSIVGLKSEYNGGIFSVNTFATESTQRFVKDEIQGDGTSGLYRLSQAGNIIINSETIVIETRDRFHSQDIIQRRHMRRYFDYEIDYQAGTLFFKEPIVSRDHNFNPNIIVVDYEVKADVVGGISAGGRAAVNLLNNKLEIGLSAIHDDDFQSEGDLYGTDLTYKINQFSELKLEFASSDVDDAGTQRKGDSYIAEYNHFTETLNGRVYVREQEGGFGLGQQSGAETATRKYGVDGSYKLSDSFRLNAEVFHEDNLATDARRDVTELDIGYMRESTTVNLGLRSAIDEDAAGNTFESELFLLGATQNFADNKLTARLNNEIALNSQDLNSSYPSRYIVGLDYSWKPSVEFYAEHEIAEGGLQDSSTTRVGVRATPWSRTQMRTSISEQSNEFGPRVFSTLGLTQSFELNDRWTADASYDSVNTIRSPGVAPFNINAPLASGTLNDDFTALSFGTNYVSEKSSFVSRIESRDGEQEDKSGVYLGWYRDESEGVGYSLKGQLYDSEFVSGESAKQADIRFSLSYRPVESKWIHLNRLDYINDERTDVSDETVRSRKLINNWKGNYLINRQNQIAFSYGIKYVIDSFDSDEYSGVTHFMGTEYRRDINERWDFGVRGSLLRSSNSSVRTHSLGVDVGWTIFENMWLSTGYNFDGFDDPDFSLAGYTAQGFFVKFRMKFDQNLFHDIKNRNRRGQ